MNFITKPFVLMLLTWLTMAVLVLGFQEIFLSWEIPAIFMLLLISYYFILKFTENRKKKLSNTQQKT